MSQTTATPAPAAPTATAADPDIVDHMLAYLQRHNLITAEKDLREAEKAIRQQWGGTQPYVRAVPADRQAKAAKVLALFNGRNASTIARELGIGRSTVYRIIKQPGR